MKKILLIVIIVIFSLTIINAYELNFNSGKENTAELATAKPIYVLVTNKNTILWEDTKLEDFIAELVADGKDVSLKQMEADKVKELTKELKKGKKWGLTQINSESEAKDGYIIIANIYNCIPIPTIGFQIRFNVQIKKANSNEILTNMEFRAMKTGWAIPRNCLKDGGEIFGEAIRSFLNDCKRQKFPQISAKDL